SAALVGFFIERQFQLAVRYISVRTEEFDFEDALVSLELLQPDITVFLDLSIEDYPKKLARAAGATRLQMLVYDHHSQSHNGLPANTTYLNPSVTPSGFDPQSPPLATSLPDYALPGYKKTMIGLHVLVSFLRAQRLAFYISFKK